jgi:hypothetical protein
MQTDEKPEQMGAQPGSQAPTPEQIRKRAFEIFQARGGAPGREWDDWLLAEAELNAGIERQSENPAT